MQRAPNPRSAARLALTLPPVGNVPSLRFGRSGGSLDPHFLNGPRARAFVSTLLLAVPERRGDAD